MTLPEAYHQHQIHQTLAKRKEKRQKQRESTQQKKRTLLMYRRSSIGEKLLNRVSL